SRRAPRGAHAPYRGGRLADTVERRAKGMTDVLVVRAEVRRLGPGARSRLVRAGTLTPYLVQTMTEAACATGRPSRLQVTGAAGPSDRLLASVREAFAGLDGRGL